MDFAVNEVVLAISMGVPHRGHVYSPPEDGAEVPLIHVVVETARKSMRLTFNPAAVRRMPYFAVTDDHDVIAVGAFASIEQAWDHARETIAHERNVALLLDYIDFAALRNRMTPHTLEALKS